jgi:hypothetical protein
MGNPTAVQNPSPAARGIGQGLWRMTLAGGAAFWIVDFVMAVSPISKAYRAAFSIANLSLALTEALLGGLLIGGCVSYLLSRSFDRIPGANPIVKAMILSLVGMLLIETLSTLTDPGRGFTYLVIDTAMNLPRFLALGIAVGYRYTSIVKGTR